MDMVERVARAIEKATSVRAYGLYDYSDYAGDWPPHVVRDEIGNVRVFSSKSREEAHLEWERLTRQYVARAAIAAMREPTGEMMRAGADASPMWQTNSAETYAIAVNDVADVFVAMIDAASPVHPQGS